MERVEKHQHAKIRQNWSMVAKILRFFFIFQDGSRHHLGLSNLQNFIG